MKTTRREALVGDFPPPRPALSCAGATEAAFSGLSYTALA